MQNKSKNLTHPCSCCRNSAALLFQVFFQKLSSLALDIINEGNSWQLKLSPRTQAGLAHYVGTHTSRTSGSNTKSSSSESIRIPPCHKCTCACTNTHRIRCYCFPFPPRSAQVNCLRFRMGRKEREGRATSLSALHRGGTWGLPANRGKITKRGYNL